VCLRGERRALGAGRGAPSGSVYSGAAVFRIRVLLRLVPGPLSVVDCCAFRAWQAAEGHVLLQYFRLGCTGSGSGSLQSKHFIAAIAPRTECALQR